jgi:hypothetical protein
MQPSSLQTTLRTTIGSNPQLITVIAIGLLSFLIFYVLFQQVAAADYLREIIAALIATILTVTITTLLLKTQTDSEEAKERNVEILRRKIDSYNVFIDSIIDTMDEDGIAPDEAKAIRKQVYHLSLFSAPDTVEQVVEYVRGHLLDDVDRTPFIDVVQAFRGELKLDSSDELLGVDLEAVDRLIGLGFGNREAFFAVRDYVDRMQEQVAGALGETAGDHLEADLPRGFLSGMEFKLTGALGVEYIVHVHYPAELDPSTIETNFFVDLAEVDRKAVKVVAEAAIATGFDWDEREDDDGPFSFERLVADQLLTKPLALSCRRGAKGKLLIDGKGAIKTIVTDISAIEGQFRAGGKAS